jgi:hypothetical protein
MANRFQPVLDAQKARFLTDATNPTPGASTYSICAKAGFDALSNTKTMLIGNLDLELDVFPPYAGKDIVRNLSVFS